MNTNEKKTKALERFIQSRETLLSTIRGLEQDALTTAPVEGFWTSKDVLAHLTSWEQLLVAPLKKFAKGDVFLPEVISDHLAWNDMQNARWKGQAYILIFDDFQNTRFALMEILLTLPDAAWEKESMAPWGDKATLIEMINGLAWHEEEHTRSILKWKAGTNTSLEG